ncbi:MAG: hypothetical protein CMJ18_09865 [Phycisphaeraceae bacterium]|nr:hypothetical protein [Phycisphaeraceae bacterium]
MSRSAACDRCLSASEQHLEDGRISRAYRLLRMANRNAVTAEHKAKSRELGGRIQETATQMLDEADRQYEQAQYTEALRAYQTVASLKKMKVGRKARRRINTARKDPARRAHVFESRAARRFEKVEALQSRLSRSCQEDPNPSAEFDAEMALATLEGDTDDCSGCEDCRAWAELSPAQRETRILADRIEMVWILDDIVRRFDDTPTGRKSARILQSMLADERTADEADRIFVEEQARRLYKLGAAYRQSGIDEKAAEQFRKIRNHFDGTEWAEKVTRELDADPALAALVANADAGEPIMAYSEKIRKTTRSIRTVAPEPVAMSRLEPEPESDEPESDEPAAPSPRSVGHEGLVRLIGPELVNGAGQTVAAATLAKNRFVLLYYTASWCVPCHALTPQLKRFYKENQAEGRFEVVMVSGDATEQDMFRYMAHHQMPWVAIPMHRIDSSGLMNRFEMETFPHLVLLDGHGRVVANSVVDGRTVGPDRVLSDLKDRIQPERSSSSGDSGPRMDTDERGAG